jgi:hypothetical protein
MGFKNSELENDLKETLGYELEPQNENMDSDKVNEIIINIDDTYRIQIDGFRNHTLYKRVITQSGKNKGQIRDEILGYCSSVSTALKTLMDDLLLQHKEIHSIEAYIDTLEELYEDILSKLDGIGERIKITYTQLKKKKKGVK